MATSTLAQCGAVGGTRAGPSAHAQTACGQRLQGVGGGRSSRAAHARREGAPLMSSSESRSRSASARSFSRAGGSRARGGARGKVGALRAFQDVSGSDDSSDLNARKVVLRKYVEGVKPQVMDAFVEKAPPEVVTAMKETVTNMLGTLPPQFFDVRISAAGENLAQLMYSVMMTGYMFRNAQYRLELQQTMMALPGASLNPQGAGDKYAAGVQKVGVEGKVVRWNETHERPEHLDVEEYLARLEGEVDVLREQLTSSQRAGEGRNKILEYLKGLEPANMNELTGNAGADVLEAMNSFIARLVGSPDEESRKDSSETNVPELARSLYWVMVVGYSLRTMEVRMDMQSSLGLPPTVQSEPSGLPPGLGSTEEP